MTDLSTDQPQVVLTCRAGHTWERTRSSGPDPKWCPEHWKYTQGNISKTNLPPARTVKQWERTGKKVGDAQYAKRWTKRWELIVRIVAANQGSFSALPLDDIDECIRHERLAELHRHYAEEEPYQDLESGASRAHPGWERARIEEVAARQSARKLGLIPQQTTVSAGNGYQTRMQEAADAVGAIQDDQADL